MSRKHALLSPSGASRWLKCTPSARLEETFKETTSSYAEEGTLAHSLAELLLQNRLTPMAKSKFKKALDKIQDDKLYKEEMFEYADGYAVFVVECFNEAKSRNSDAQIILEQPVSLEAYVPDSFGHVDVSIVSDHILNVIDFKYGKGVPVSAEENKQMMLYGLGVLNEVDLLFDISVVRMTIYQPRIGNISTYEMPKAALLHWAETELRERAFLAFNGAGVYQPGDHCRFCRARGMCRANALKNLELKNYEFADATLLTPGEVADILTVADNFEKWLEGVKAHALEQAKEGFEWPGYKLVEGRSVRKYEDPEAVANLLLKEGYTPDDIYAPKKLLGLGALEGELGKDRFNSLLSPYIVKPPGAPTLVPASDKRQAISGSAKAQADFAGVDIQSFID
jgi:hypothetical protein